jgi:hypothetical protein
MNQNNVSHHISTVWMVCRQSDGYYDNIMTYNSCRHNLNSDWKLSGLSLSSCIYNVNVKFMRSMNCKKTGRHHVTFRQLKYIKPKESAERGRKEWRTEGESHHWKAVSWSSSIFLVRIGGEDIGFLWIVDRRIQAAQYHNLQCHNLNPHHFESLRP